MSLISKQTWNRINKLSEKKLDKLAEIIDIGFLQDDLDREEKVMILTITEQSSELLKALKQLKASK